MRDHDAMLKMYKEQQDEARQRQIYLELLEDIRDGIVAGSVKVVQSSCKALLSLSGNEPLDKIRSFLTDLNSPFFGTNFVIFACKHKQHAILESLLKEDGFLLKLCEKVGLEFISLEMEDSSHHTAFYYAIRSNEVKTVELLVRKWRKCHASQDEEKLNDLLSRSYLELKVRNVDISRQMEKYIVGKLLATLYTPSSKSSNASVEISAKVINDRVDFLSEKIEVILKEEQSSLELFLFRLQSIARSIHFLKNAMKETYRIIPWEEIEFCLVIFILSRTRKENLTPVYRHILPKQKLMNHLRDFLGCIQQERCLFVGPTVIESHIPDIKRHIVVDSIISKYPVLDGLYRDYESLRDIRSLEIIKRYVRLALKADPDENEGKLVIMRMIQILSQCMKNTLECPKMSDGMAKWLLSCAKENIRPVLLQFRNSSPRAVLQMVKIEEAADKSFLCDLIESTRSMVETIEGIFFFKTARVVEKMQKNMENCEDMDVVGEHLECCLMCKLDPPEHFLKDISMYLLLNRQVTTQLLKDDVSPREHGLLVEIEKLCVQVIAEMLPMLNPQNKILAASTTIEIISNACDEALQRFRDLVGYTRKKMFEPEIPEIQGKPSPTLSICIKLIKLSDSIALNHSINEYLDVFKRVCGILHMAEVLLDSESCGELSRNLSEHNKSFLLGSEGYPIQIEDEADKRLSRNITDLKHILKNDNANPFTRTKHTESSEAALELLVMDVLSALSSRGCLPRNFLAIDSGVPTLVGERMLHHLELNDDIMDILLTPATLLILNGEQLVLDTVANFCGQFQSALLMDISSLRAIEEDSAKIITSQQTLLSVLANGSLEEVVACIESGADISGRSIFCSSAAHYAAVNPNKDLLNFVVESGQSVKVVNFDGETPLHFAAKHGLSNNVKLLSPKIPVDCMDNFGRTPLHFSAGQGNIRAVQLLLSQGADPTLIDNFGYSTVKWALYNSQEEACRALVTALFQQTLPAHVFFVVDPLFVAAEMGSRDIVEYIFHLSAGRAFVMNQLVSPLYISVLRGRIEVVKFLLDNKVSDINGKNSGAEGFTALICAVRENHEKKVELLLKYGADVDVTDAHGRSSLYYVAKTGNAVIAEMLLAKKPHFYGAQPSLLYPLHYAALFGRKEVLPLFLKYKKSSINVQDVAGLTSLHHSALRGDSECLTLLIKHGANVNVRAADGSTALKFAAELACENIVSFLIQSGADVNITDNDGISPLHCSAVGGRHGVMKILLENGAKIENTCFPIPPLHSALESGDVQCVELLLRNNSCVNHIDSAGNTPLHYAAHLGHSQIVKCLLEGKANVNVQNCGLTPLHTACLGGSVEVVQFLIESGGGMNPSRSISLLKLAVQSNSKDIVALLLDKKIQVSQRDIVDAARYGFAEILAMLLDHIPKSLLNDHKLWEAACSGRDFIGHNNISETLLNKGADANASCSFNGIPSAQPLHIAASCNNLRSLQVLVDNGGNANLLDKDGELPLHKAVKNGHLKAGMILLGRNPNILVGGMHQSTLLACAIANRQHKFLKLFLKPQYKLNIRTLCKNPKWPLLHLAAESGDVDIVEMLVDEGADIFHELNGNKAVHIAALKGFPDVVEYFLSLNMDVYERGSGGNNLLHFAAQGGADCAKVAEMLLIKKNMDPNRTNDRGLTPLITAYYANNHIMIQLLLNHGAIYNKYPHGVNSEQLLLKCSAKSLVDYIDNLFSATEQGDLRQVQLCTSRRVPLNVRNEQNETPLLCASRKGHHQIVDIFLENGADPNLTGTGGCTALHYAAKHSHLQIVLSLLGRGAKFDVTNKANKTSLDCAKTREIVTFLKLLRMMFVRVKARDEILPTLGQIRDWEKKKWKALLNCQDADGSTLLAAAILSDHPEIDHITYFFLSKTPLTFIGPVLAIGKVDEALSLYYSEAKQLHNALLGAVCLHTIALELKAKGRYAEALEYFIEIRETYKQLLGNDCKKTLSVTSILGWFLGERGQLKEALAELREAFSKQKALLHPSDPELLQTQGILSPVLCRLGKLSQATAITLDLIEKLKGVYGSMDPRVFDVEENLAAVFFEQEKSHEALKMCEDVLAKRIAVLGPEHPHTLRARERILSMYQIMRNMSGWLKCMSQICESNVEQMVQLGLTQGMLGLSGLFQGTTFEDIFCMPQSSNYGQSGVNSASQSNSNLEGLDFFPPSPSNFMNFMLSARRNANKSHSKFQGGRKKEEILTFKDVVKAISADDKSIVEKMLRVGFDLNTRDGEGRTPLHYAVSRGKKDLVVRLIKRGARVTDTSNKGNTPFHLAANSGDNEMMKLLIQSLKKKDKAVLDLATNNKGMTALHVAASKGYIDVVETLLKNGARYDIFNIDGKMPVDLSVSAQVTTILNNTRLSAEAMDRLGMKCYWNTDKDGNRPVGLPMSSHMPQFTNSGHSEANQTPRFNLNSGRSDEFRVLPSDSIDCLIGAKQNESQSHSKVEGKKKKKEEESLSFKDVVKAISTDDNSIVEKMLKLGFDFNAKDDEGRTPLHYAVSKGKKDLVVKLIERGARVSDASNKGNTPFHLAANSGDNDMMKLLIQSLKKEDKAVLDWATTNKGMTPLHVAASKGYVEIVKTLLKNGAQYDALDQDGKMPVDLSVSAQVTTVLIETARCLEEMNRLNEKLKKLGTYQQ